MAEAPRYSVYVNASDTQVRTTVGNLKRVIVIAPGSAGNLIIWDGADVDDEDDEKRLMLKAFGDMTTGDNMEFDVPVSLGIRFDVPTGGIFRVVHSDW